MAEDIKKKVGIQRKRSYLNRDFQGFRAELLNHARTFFPDKIQDFSESSVGGLFLDMAAYIGDNMSFYLDHQFREMDPDTAVESANIENMVRKAGLKITGNSPASVDVKFYIEVPTSVDAITGETIPMHNMLPIIRSGASVKSQSGIYFFLTHDINFADRDENSEYYASVDPLVNSQTGQISSYVFSASGLCVSGSVSTQTETIGSTFIPYRTVTLNEPHTTTILRVYDSDGNEYYEVESLSQDTVFKKNVLSSGESSIEVIPAPYRFTSETDITTKRTRLQFGAGNVLEDSSLANPSSLALPLYGKQTFSSYSLDPNTLLQNKSLGIAPYDTTLTIVYKHGGGANHNVASRTITEISSIDWTFRNGVSYSLAQNVKNSIACENPTPATGGALAPTLDQLKAFIPTGRMMQNRVVSREDLLARIYTMPTDFGSVYRANVIPNPNNALASILYIVAKDELGQLTTCSDALKRNLSTYLNEFRLIGDAMDVLDAKILNFKIEIDVIIHPNSNINEVSSTIISEIAALYPTDSVELGASIVESDIVSTVSVITGVLSVTNVKIYNVSGEGYSSEQKKFDLINRNGIFYAEPNEIFELRNPNEEDIVVNIQ